MVEDFLNTTSTTLMSAVPLQMLIYVYQPAAGSCSIVPVITVDRPNRACIGVPIGIPLTERIVATVYCSNDTIKEFITASPLYMNKTSIAPVSGVSNQWYIMLKWTLTADQKGLSGSQHCVNFVVGYVAPNLITPTLVQGSGSPSGSVFSNYSVFSIQAAVSVYHPNRNGTYVRIYNHATPSVPAWEADCGYSPNCIYSGNTVLFYVKNANWQFGAHYYILLSSGTASGNVFCAPESAPINNPNFWNFDIWDPGLSSTTSTTSTPPTTATVTTRAVSTTTTNANVTTTGIVITSGSTVTTTTTQSTTSSSTSTTTSETKTTALPEVDVLTPAEYVEQCKQPLAITNAATMGVMAIMNMVGMFTKLEKVFNPSRIAANVRRKKMMNRVAPRRFV